MLVVVFSVELMKVCNCWVVLFGWLCIVCMKCCMLLVLFWIC